MDHSELLKNTNRFCVLQRANGSSPWLWSHISKNVRSSQADRRGWWACCRIHNEPLVTRIGKLESGEYFLRFVNDPLIDSDVWVWWGFLRPAYRRRLVPSGLEGDRSRCSPGLGRRVHHLYPGVADPLAVSSPLRWLRFFSLPWKPRRSGFFSRLIHSSVFSSNILCCCPFICSFSSIFPCGR